MTDKQRIEQLETDVRVLARLLTKSAGVTPELQRILTNEGRLETRPQIPTEARAAETPERRAS